MSDDILVKITAKNERQTERGLEYTIEAVVESTGCKISFPATAYQYSEVVCGRVLDFSLSLYEPES